MADRLLSARAPTKLASSAINMQGSITCLGPDTLRTSAIACSTHDGFRSDVSKTSFASRLLYTAIHCGRLIDLAGAEEMPSALRLFGLEQNSHWEFGTIDRKLDIPRTLEQTLAFLNERL